MSNYSSIKRPLQSKLFNKIKEHSSLILLDPRFREDDELREDEELRKDDELRKDEELREDDKLLEDDGNVRLQQPHKKIDFC